MLKKGINKELNKKKCSNMTPQIFPGLPQPKSKLYFDLQGMIADNGWRVRLAEILECEMVKSYWKTPLTPQGIRNSEWHYSLEEDDLVLAGNMIIQGRSRESVYKRRYVLKKNGLLK